MTTWGDVKSVNDHDAFMMGDEYKACGLDHVTAPEECHSWALTSARRVFYCLNGSPPDSFILVLVIKD